VVYYYCMDTNKGNKMNTQTYNNKIMNLMAAVESQTKVMFQDSHPELETEIWEAIDSKNVARLNTIVKKLDGVLGGALR